MVRHYSDTKLFNVSNYEKVYLCEKNYKKFNTREERGLQRCCSIEDTVAEGPCDKAAEHTEAAKPQRCCSIEDTIAEGPCDKAAEHTKATKSQRCCSIEDTVAITSQQTKQRRAPAKPMHTEKDTVDVRKSQGTRESGKATTFSQHLRERCGEGHSPAC